MLDLQGSVPKHGFDSGGFAPKNLRPQLVVVHDLNLRRHLKSPQKIEASTLLVSENRITKIAPSLAQSTFCLLVDKQRSRYPSYRKARTYQALGPFSAFTRPVLLQFRNIPSWPALAE